LINNNKKCLPNNKILNLITTKEGNKRQSFGVKHQTLQKNKEKVVPANAQITGKKLFAKMLRDENSKLFFVLLICLLAATLVKTLKSPTTQHFN